MSSLVVPYKAHLDCLLAPTKPSDAEFVSAALAGEIIAVLAGMYDYVIIDAPPAFTDVILKCFDMADVYILLTTLDMPALKNLVAPCGLHHGLERSPADVVAAGQPGVGIDPVDPDTWIAFRRPSATATGVQRHHPARVHVLPRSPPLRHGSPRHVAL